MKQPKTHPSFRVILCLLTLFVSITAAEPLGTVFTYQGHLYDNNDVADGLYDFQFRLYDADVGGNQLSSDVNVPDLDVIDGYFTTLLDFGSGIFDGNAVWLDIGVRLGDMNDPNIYSTLQPRQKVTPTPYALYAKNVQNPGSDSDWTISDGNMYSAVSGNVGIGSNSPSYKLDVAGPVNLNKGSTGIALLVDGTEALWYDGTYFSWGFGGQRNYFANHVGIGTTSPTATLHVIEPSGGDPAIKIEGLLPGVNPGIQLVEDNGKYARIMLRESLGDVLQFWTGSVEAVTIQQNGNVGIGTTNPTEAILVVDPATTQTGIYIHGTNSSEIEMGSGTANIYSNGPFYLGPQTDNDLRFVTQGVTNTKMAIKNNGDVGIGTITPATKLSVIGAVRGAYDSGETEYVEMGHGGGNGYLNWFGDGNLDFRYNSSTLVSIQQDGDVGIGTSTPNSQLEVAGTVEATAFVGDGSGLTGIITSETDPTVIASVKDGVSWSEVSSIPAGFADGIDNVGGGDNDWAWSSGSGLTGDLHRSGKVCIGTTAPAAAQFTVDSSYLYGGYYTADSLGNTVHAIHAEYTGTGNYDAKAVYGRSVPQDFYGYGGYFVGGGTGVYGEVLPTGSATYRGVEGKVDGGSGNNEGVFGEALGSSGTNYGVIGYAHDGTTNYGVYGSAGTTGTNYAGYFEGRGYFSNNVGIGTTSPQRSLHVSDVMRLEPRATAPSSPSEGDIYMNNTTHKLMVYDGTTWQACW